MSFRHISAEFAQLHALNVRYWQSLRDLSMSHARWRRQFGDRRGVARNVSDARRLNRRAIEEGRAARGFS